MKINSNTLLLLAAVAIIGMGSMAYIINHQEETLQNLDGKTFNLAKQSTSDETDNIEKDLRDTELNNIDSELTDIEMELNTP